MKIMAHLREVRVDIQQDYDRGCYRLSLDLLVPTESGGNHELQQIMMAAQAMGRIYLSVDEDEVIEKVPRSDLPTSLKEKAEQMDLISQASEHASTW